MRASDGPDDRTVTSSGYVPASTCTVWPAVTFAAAALIVQNGCVAVPDPASEHAGLLRSTNRVVVAAPACEPSTSATTMATIAAAARHCLIIAHPSTASNRP